VRALSPQNRLIGIVGAVESDIGLWYFTNGHWANGLFSAVAAGFLVVVYLRRERRLKRQSGGRRY